MIRSPTSYSSHNLNEPADDDHMEMELEKSHNKQLKHSTTTVNSPFPSSCHSILSAPHIGPILCVRFNHLNGDYLISGGQDRTICLWQPEKGKLIKQYPVQHGREVFDVQLTQSNEKFISGSGDKLAILWDVSSGEVLRRFRGHTGAVQSVALNEDDSILATGSYDQTVRLWDIRAFSRDPIQTLADAKDSVSCVRIHEKSIISVSMDGYLRRYDLKKSESVFDCIGVPLSSVTVSHDGECYLVSCLDSTRKLIDRSNGQVLNEYHGATAKEFSLESCFDNTDGYIIGGDENGHIHGWDLVEGKEIHTYTNAHAGPVSSLTWHPKEKKFASASGDGTIKFWK